MKAKVTEQGITIPKELFEGMDEVEIRRQDGMIIIIAAQNEDPIFQLGKHPVTLDVTDASKNLDHYLYDSL